MNTLSTGLAIAVMTSTLATAVVGCGGTEETLAGADAVDRQRDGALAVFLNRKVTDSLDRGAGDRVDWKYVDVTKPGRLQVAVAFDSPERIRGQVVLRDNFATLIERQPLSSDRSVYKFETINAVRGRYYIELEAETGGSVYTLGVGFTEPSFGEFNTAATNFDRVEGGSKRKGKWRPKDPATTTAAAETHTAEVDTSVTDEPVDEGGEPVEEVKTLTIGGAIQRVIPMADDDGALLTIALSGSDFGALANGARGTISGLGATVVVRRRHGRVVSAYTKAEAETVKPYKRVVFTVK